MNLEDPLSVQQIPTFDEEKFASFKCNNLYRIEDDHLINYKGEKFPKISYVDDLHEDLHFVLKDPEQADIIYRAYCLHILPHLPNEFRAPFSTALLKTSIFFGATHFSPQNTFLAALKETNAMACEWLLQQQNSLADFISHANRPARPGIVQKKDSSNYTIVILTTSASGGNYSVTKAMENFLSKWKNLRCVIVDVETVARDTDPIMLATGVGTYDGIYVGHLQVDHQGLDVCLMRDIVSKQLGNTSLHA